MKGNRFVDKFIDEYDKYSSRDDDVTYEKIYVKPNKFVSLLGFLFGLFLLFFVITSFNFDMVYILLLLLAIWLLIYYGLNLFTKKGFGLPRTVPVRKDR